VAADREPTGSWGAPYCTPTFPVPAFAVAASTAADRRLS
jgi:hypothetical protein